ncbi:H-NS family nucleoid-associated regulatory protein [Paraburkholderia humisilvae]|uniref:DNA-binding protein Bv3F n=1 Tax=Paraburkholderia humisilvae TaxID=627669 RepID=A0A6J5F8L5_9BURK|nr:H-NS histone family protein [Paraburkholderia humisilvae]CAB3773827.1 DNA-binding protein Bv3F [Paraburkholderia humisilvae]
MATYLELRAQAETLLQQAEKARLAEIQVVIEDVRSRVAEYGLTPEQVFGRERASRKTGARGAVLPKYRDPSTGTTWSGRGREPHWIKGKKRERFLIKT